MRIPRVGIWLVGALAMTVGVGHAQIVRPKAAVVPFVENDAVHAGTRVRVALQVSLPEGLHVQSNAPRDPSLIPTVLRIEPPAGITVAEIVYPPPTDLKQVGQDQPLAVFEALGSGVPVVVADQGGASLMVDDGRTGLRAPATPEGMAAAVQRLLHDPELAGRLAAAGRAEVLERFTTEAMTRQLEALYERLLAATAGG